MASYDVYKKQADQSTDDYAKKKQAQAATLWESMQGGYDQLNETARKNAETQIENQKQEYRDLHDQNAVQELLDRRYTNEAMANAGLTDSGLNRTQQTAITLARGNRDASLTRQQQAARDATMLALDQMIAENKAKAAAEKAAIDQQVWADIENYRNAQYGAIGDWAEAENAQALALAKLDAEAKQKEADRLAESAKQLETNRLAVYADMIGAGYTSEEAWNEAIRLFPGAGESGEAKTVIVTDPIEKTLNKELGIEKSSGVVYGPVQTIGQKMRSEAKQSAADTTVKNQVDTLRLKMQNKQISEEDLLETIVDVLYSGDKEKQRQALAYAGYDERQINSIMAQAG